MPIARSFTCLYLGASDAEAASACRDAYRFDLSGVDEFRQNDERTVKTN